MSALIVILALVGLGATWFGAPGAFHLVARSWVGQGWYPDGHPLRMRPDAAQLVSVLSKAGFVELGTRWEKDWPLDFPSRDISMVAPDGTWGLVFVWLSGFRVMFLNRFTDGSILMTSQDSPNRPFDDGGLSFGSAPKGSTAEAVLEVHRARAAKLREAGKVPIVDQTREGRLEMCRAYFALEGTRGLRLRRARSYLSIFVPGVVMLVLAFAIAIARA